MSQSAVSSSSTEGSRAGAPRIGRALLVVSGGARRAARAGREAISACEARGVSCRVVETRAPRHAVALTRELTQSDSFDAVFAVGGDGTAMEVVTALADRDDRPPVGIVPAGTANVLARTIGVPMRPARAVTALLDGEVARLDLGRTADGSRFAIGLGVGLDAAMIAGASARLKRRLGYLAYALSAARAGLGLRRFRARLTVDGKSHEIDTASVLIANFGAVLGGLVRFGDGILHDDGLLNACVYSPRSRLDAARILWRMLRGNIDCDRCFFTLSGRHFTLEIDPAGHAQADGELLGLTPLEVTVEPGAATLLVPRGKHNRMTMKL
ncbi:MAG TPA: diacylglycerol kinase family protein [Gemmatimonadaceae bacterium]|nr:diacylglycerol kinase family protein [Gemmatimonadaceae bacterium]